MIDYGFLGGEPLRAIGELARGGEVTDRVGVDARVVPRHHERARPDSSVRGVSGTRARAPGSQALRPARPESRVVYRGGPGRRAPAAGAVVREQRGCVLGDPRAVSARSSGSSATVARRAGRERRPSLRRVLDRPRRSGAAGAAGSGLAPTRPSASSNRRGAPSPSTGSRRSDRPSSHWARAGAARAQRLVVVGGVVFASSISMPDLARSHSDCATAHAIAAGRRAAVALGERVAARRTRGRRRRRGCE